MKDGDPLLVSSLLVAAGLCKTRGEALKLIRAGGAYLNDRQLTPPDELVFDYDLLRGRYLFLRRGKRDVAAVELTVDPAPQRGCWLEYSGPVRDGVRPDSQHDGEMHQA